MPGHSLSLFDLYYTGLIGNVVMFLVGYFAGLLLPRADKGLDRLTIWDQGHHT